MRAQHSLTPTLPGGAGQVAQINVLTLQLQALLEAGGHSDALQGLPTTGLSRLQSFPALMLEQGPPRPGSRLQLEAPESLRGFLLEPGRQSSDDLAAQTDSINAAASSGKALPQPAVLEDISEEPDTGIQVPEQVC